MADPNNVRLSATLAGGALMDVGCYVTSSSRLLAGAAAGLDFDDPIDVQAQGVLGETGVDDWTVAAVKYASGVVMQRAQANGILFSGTDGDVEVNRGYFKADPQSIAEEPIGPKDVHSRGIGKRGVPPHDETATSPIIDVDMVVIRHLNVLRDAYPLEAGGMLPRA